MAWADLCERLLERLEAAGADVSDERIEFGILMAGCSSRGCPLMEKDGR